MEVRCASAERPREWKTLQVEFSSDTSAEAFDFSIKCDQPENDRNPRPQGRSIEFGGIADSSQNQEADPERESCTRGQVTVRRDSARNTGMTTSGTTWIRGKPTMLTGAKQVYELLDHIMCGSLVQTLCGIDRRTTTSWAITVPHLGGGARRQEFVAQEGR